MRLALGGVGVLLSVAAGLLTAQRAEPKQGVALSELAWTDAESWLTPATVVVLPLGAGALEQGPHMKLDSDDRLARALAARVMAASPVVVAPSLNYHFFPAYADYPGSTSLSETSARDITVEAVRSLARSGPRRFYVLNTSPSTLAPLSAAAATLADSGILLGYTDPDDWLKQPQVLRQRAIDLHHADEAATSMMLFVDPAAVDMTRATREYPDRGAASTSGTFGDATLATKEKGAALVDALVAGMLADIERLRNAPLPAARTAPAPPPAPVRPLERREARLPTGCTPGDERAIREIGPMFSGRWAQNDAEAIALMFTPMGDIRHPDGSIERGQDVIREDRIRLFMQRGYQRSKHPLQLNDVRCVSGAVAIADGKWELRLDDDQQSAPGRGLSEAKVNNGLCTLIVVKSGDAWRIEAWRYTINPPAGAPQPTLLPKPGYAGRGGAQ